MQKIEVLKRTFKYQWVNKGQKDIVSLFFQRWYFTVMNNELGLILAHVIIILSKMLQKLLVTILVVL